MPARMPAKQQREQQPPSLAVLLAVLGVSSSGCWRTKGYTDARDPVHTSYRGRNKPASMKDAYRAHARLRAPGKQANA